MNRGKWLILCIAIGFALIGAVILNQFVLFYGKKRIVLESISWPPREFFKGNYALFRFSIAEVELPGDWDAKKGGAVYTELAPSGESWQAVRTHNSHPGYLPNNHVALRGQVKGYDHARARVSIDSLVDISSPGWLATQSATAAWRQNIKGATNRDSAWWHGGLDAGKQAYILLESSDSQSNNWSVKDVSPKTSPWQNLDSADKSLQKIVISGITTIERKYIGRVTYGFETYVVKETTRRLCDRARVEILVNSSGVGIIDKVTMYP